MVGTTPAVQAATELLVAFAVSKSPLVILVLSEPRLPALCCDLHISLYEERTAKPYHPWLYQHNAQFHRDHKGESTPLRSPIRKRHHLKIMPPHCVLDMIQRQFPGPEQVHGLQRHSRNHGRHKRLPHGLVGKVVQQLPKAKGTPPVGEPKATENPAAEAAERTSRFCVRFSAVGRRVSWEGSAQQQATWTSGPSLPSQRPGATARH